MSADGVAYEIGSETIVTEQFEDDFVVLDLVGGRYYALDGGSAQIWKALIAGAAFEAILGASPETRHEDIRALRDKLVGFGLIRPAAAPAPDAALPEGLSALAGDIDVQVFDDLAELLVADPIHDVDEEIGWPHRKA